MIQYLIRTTTEIRVELEEDANELHKEIEAFAHDNNYTLSSWTQTYKNKKVKGEITEEYYLCKYILIFNDVKEPNSILGGIDYEIWQMVPREEDIDGNN